jgi:FixJ family two-component response regulator
MHKCQDREVDLTPINVLIVDDEWAIASEILEFLSQDGILATAAIDAPSAARQMRIAGPGAFTVIVTDVNMPGQDGVSLAQDILATSPEEAAVEIIIMTGRGTQGMVLEALQKRAFEFFRKPFRLSELADAVRLAHAAAVARRQRHRGRPDGVADRATEAPGTSSQVYDTAGQMEHFLGYAGAPFSTLGQDEGHGSLDVARGLKALTQLHDDKRLPEALTDFVARAYTAVVRLVDATLVLADLQLGRLPGVSTPTQADDLLQTLARRHVVEALACGQSVDIDAAPNLVVRTDLRCLLAALDQLVINAIHFGPSGQTVRVMAREIDGEAVFLVIDTGSGFDPALLDDLRNSFGVGVFSHPRATRVPSLGLLLAHSAALALGGRLELESARGRGTIASITLPLAADRLR